MSGFYELPPDERPTYPLPCRACGGEGVTGERYEFPVGEAGRVLLCDVICPSCTGCGNGDPEHRKCPRDLHAYTDDEVEVSDPEHPCYSCGSGRGWNPVQGFGEDPDTMVVLRVPCGCAEARMVPVDL